MAATNPTDERAAPSRHSVVAREDLALFINACFACTRQDEFYGDSRGQAVSIGFLHDYILGNYRRLYGRCLATGINHSNRAEVVFRLLASGPLTPADFRQEEGALIRAALGSLPPPRVYRLFQRLRRARVNNRRTRATIRDYLGSRDLAFDAVKYRRKVGDAAEHAHVKLAGEAGAFLFEPLAGTYETPLFDSFRRAHFAKSAVYELPYTVAEGFAAKHGIERSTFLEGIEGQLTTGERLRLQRTSARETGKAFSIELERAPLTKLALFWLAMGVAEREERQGEFDRALARAAEHLVRKQGQGGALGRVACVLDRSYSASGSREKRNRPLAVALAASYVVRAMARETLELWAPTAPSPSRLFVTPQGQSRLAEPVIDALEWGADLVLIVSDGFENDPPGATEAVVRAYRAHIAPDRDAGRERPVSFVHVNPVFDEETFEPKTLGASIPTVGVRDAEDLPTMLAFARFVDGSSGLAELEAHLARLSADFTAQEVGRP